MTLQKVIPQYGISFNATAEAPSAYGPSFYTNVIRKSREGKSASFIKNFYNPRSVFSLLLRSSPSAILRLVITRAINAVYRGSFWPRPHIPQKTFKAIKPLRAYCDTLASPKSVIGFIGIEAPSLHRSPRPIFRTAPIAGVAVIPFRCGESFTSNASTAFCVTLSKIAAANDGAATAIAATIPTNFLAGVGGLACDGQPAIFMADEINLFHGHLLAWKITT